MTCCLKSFPKAVTLEAKGSDKTAMQKAEAGVLGAKALKWEGVWEVPGTEKGQRHQSMKSGGREEPGPLK